MDASTLVDMLRTMKLVVLNGCKSEELGLKLREAGVPNVVSGGRSGGLDLSGRQTRG